MRQRWLAAAVAAWMPLGAGAQEAVDAPEEGALERLARDPSSRDLGGAPLELPPEAPTTHQVVPGDTLWDLSEHYLGSPWQWPRVWSFNPEIENPHWIFPGDRVRLAPESIPMAPAEPTAVAEPAYLPPQDEPEVAVVGTIGYQGGGRRVRTNGIITPRALQESGTIRKSWEEKSLLSTGDRVYLDWPKDRQVEVGQSYVIFRTERKIHHPTTGDFMGHFTKILGTVRVTDASPWRDHVTGVIDSSFEEIERGDRIGPHLGDFDRAPAARPNTRNLVGRIAATLERGVMELGQDHVVFLDRGRAHGVEEGNRMQVVRAGDGLDFQGMGPAGELSALPAEVVGELLVVEVQEHSAAAVVTRSLRELRVGDRFVMRADR